MTSSKSVLKHVDVEEHTHNIYMDISRVKYYLHFKPKIQIKDGLNEIIINYKRI